MGLTSRWVIFISVCVVALFALLFYKGFFASSELIGSIESIEKENAIVKILEGETLKSGDRVCVDLSVSKNTTFQIGDKIKVRYGNVGEKYPLYIETKSVILIDF